jgi:NADH:ubiquinone oxidoreductase subunit 6 (subunit J)
MDSLKRALGYLWILIGIAAIVVLVVGAVMNIDINGKADINKPIPWIIIIVIFTPISIGLMMFGWYAIKGEYGPPSDFPR